MNENHVIQCVQRASRRFLNKYVILAAMLCSFGLASAQNSDGKVSGTVLSETNGEPLIGVSILVKGATRGTVTDFNGAFTLQAKVGETLRVSYIGFLAQEVKISNPQLTIRLKEDQHSLDEVVVVGYGVQKKKLSTGASVQVKGDELAKMNTRQVEFLEGTDLQRLLEAPTKAPNQDIIKKRDKAILELLKSMNMMKYCNWLQV